ncbi:MAG: hypothetical protein ACKVVP_25435 [Chloroflexota bacterium]
MLRTTIACSTGHVGPRVALSRRLLLALVARESFGDGDVPAVRQVAWYPKVVPTLTDTLAHVRRQLWPARLFSRSPDEGDLITIPRGLLDQLTKTLAYAA